MVSDTIYDLCLPTLQDDAVPEDEKTDKIEELLRKDAALSGKALEDAVLGVLWRHREATTSATSPPPIRATIIRRPSPAPWQVQRSAAPSPRSASASLSTPPGFSATAPAFNRTKSSAASPFSSPRPSPRLAFATPAIPHSPSLSAYQFSESSPSTENYGDFGSDNVDWLVNDDASSTTSFGDAAFASDWAQPHQAIDMSPYDMLRVILRDDKSDDELEKILESNGYDLSQTIMALTTDASRLPSHQSPSSMDEQNRTYLVGKSMSPGSRPLTPAGQAKSGIVCKYWLSSGHCARADCRFSHDLSNHICKYWLMGSCLAGDSCIFSHDPSSLVSKLSMNGAAAPFTQGAQPDFQLQDYDSFPSLQPTTSNPYEQPLASSLLNSAAPIFHSASPPSSLNPFPTFVPTGPRGHSSSRPTSRHQSRTATPSTLAVNDDEAFPTLGSAAANRSTKRHGKRGHGGAASKESPLATAASLADVVRMSPSPSPMIPARRGLRTAKSATGSREDSAAAMNIPAPEHIPWLETGESANKAYLKARAEAFKHGGLRNKFLQSAAQAWNRNDARGAKALSLRGQNENNLMKEAHREAARCLYEERNKNSGSGKELFVDLHGECAGILTLLDRLLTYHVQGLHPEEAVSYLTACLLDNSKSSRPIYAITGSGHHSKNGKDKIGKAVRTYLEGARFAFREFSIPGSTFGGILGIDPSSFDRDTVKGIASSADSGVGFAGSSAEDTKVRILKREHVAQESDLRP